MTKNFRTEYNNIKPGDHSIIKLDVGRLPSDTSLSIQVHVYRSKTPGPTSLILAGVHGDEINGIEIVRRCIKNDGLEKIRHGNIIVIPLLNVYGFINFNRFVPDGKDVNRSFPGTKSGSLASRIAGTLTKYILPEVDYIFDFHTGGDSRYNYPQIRYSQSDKKAAELSRIFGAPYIIQSGIISKSLRKSARDSKIPILVFEGGEATRLNGPAIKIGSEGLRRCLSHLGYQDLATHSKPKKLPILITKTSWIRASFSGIFIWTQKSGDLVTKGDKLGSINDPNGKKSISVLAHKTGYLVGHNNASVVNQGDALFHLGYEFESTY